MFRAEKAAAAIASAGGGDQELGHAPWLKLRDVVTGGTWLVVEKMQIRGARPTAMCSASVQHTCTFL